MIILVAEDEPDILGEISHFFRSEGHTVLEAPDGIDALRLLERHPIDCVLTDFDMPHLDGLSLLGRLRKHWPKVAVAVMSGDATLGEPYWLRLGAVAFLAKPFGFTSLRRVLDVFCEREA